MSDLKLVVFDCDGTLVDSQHMIVAAMSRAMAEHGLVELPRATVLSIVGLSLEQAITKLLPTENVATVARVQESYRAAFFHLRDDPDLHEPLFEGTRQALTWLASRGDVVLGVATGKSQRGLRAILELHDIRDHFVTLQTADNHPSKPHPSMMLQAMAETGARPENTVIIGDTSYDMVMGRDAQVRSIGVSWGYHKADELHAHGAELVLEQFADLQPALETIWSGASQVSGDANVLRGGQGKKS
ncbi:MAG: HAD-IA family hydrolase [Parvibaculum sp.]